MALEKWLLVPDTHVPYHDVKAFRLMLKAAKAAQIKNACILGDFIDCFAVSSHPKSPDRRLDLGYEVGATREALGEIEEVCTGGKNLYVDGNHEDRLERYLVDKAPALFGSVKLHKLLGLAERGWRHVRYKDHVSIGKLYITHDVGKAGKYAHYDALNAFQGNVVIGHTHRLGYTVEGTAKGKPHVGAMLGWLGDFEACDYMVRVRARRDWVHGFGVAYKEPNGCVHVTPIPIVNGKVVIEGRLIQ
jgi:predicted phosphodiesterase